MICYFNSDFNPINELMIGLLGSSTIYQFTDSCLQNIVTVTEQLRCDTCNILAVSFGHSYI